MALTITTAMTDTFKKEILMGTHLFKTSGGNTFKMALFKAAAGGGGTWGAATTNYGSGSGSPTNSNMGTDEASDTSGNAQYTAGGITMTPNADPALDTANHVAYIDWTTDPNWGPAATIAARGCMLYNSTASGAAVAVFSFGSDQSSITGSFILTLPTPSYSAALLRIA